MKGLPIKTATRRDEHWVIDPLVLAFRTDPGVRWMYPDPRQYLTHFPDFVHAFAGRAFECGTAFHVDGFYGAALWLPPGTHPDDDALVALLRRTVPEPERAGLLALFERMGSYHPEEPHWYLPLIGVAPTHQRMGYGSDLLSHVLRMSDRDGMSAYLESSNLDNIPLYRRHGFEVLGTIQVGSSPPITPMLRAPR